MNTKKLIIGGILILLIGINFYLYRAEFRVLVDPNDNIFQYALVDEAKIIWRNIFSGRLSPFYLFDSWNERWAEGFALSNYYSHLPQAILALFGGFKLFVLVRTLMLILLPLMFFWAGAILHLPSGLNLILALFSQAIFTDGLYGIDVSSFLWRGWGLSAQLMAVFFLPPAFAYALDYFKNPTSHKASLGKAVLFNFLVAQSHFGMFSLLLLGYGVYLICEFISHLVNKINPNFKAQMTNQILNPKSKRNHQGFGLWILGLNWILDFDIGILKRSFIFIGLLLLSLSYFIVPFFFQGQYRNFSVWDPIWKFDSWGMKQVLIWFLNGDLFDFGRLPIITFFVLFGVLIGFAGKNKLMKYLSLIFLIYLFLFFGRSTFGKLVDLIPGLSEYHLHRVIVMVQFTGIFLASYLAYEIIQLIKKLFKNYELRITNLYYAIGVIIFIPILWYLEKPLINYAKDNSVWIERSNQAYLRDLPDYEKIKKQLKRLPQARIYVGKPGNWGRKFTVGEIPLYMVLSQDGFPVIGFLPESWSPNSDPEQFFDENNPAFYDLYNAGYAVFPANFKAPEFVKPISKAGKYNLYQIQTGGWFDAGQSNITVKTKKTNLLNVTRLWFTSKFFRQKDFPKIDLNQNAPDGKRWHIEMADLNNYINLNDGIERSIWRANPYADSTELSRSYRLGTIEINNQQVLANGYRANIDVKDSCSNCVVVLKQSYHPNWQVKINGEKIRTFPVFPFYVAVEAENPGNYEIVAEYKPGNLKTVLIFLEIGLVVIVLFRRRFFFH